ncbi:MAG: competence protein ComEC, partial [Acidimicrobiia bacterium]|nr:competence protein ComEC [Acidimicrobiia bacterium]
ATIEILWPPAEHIVGTGSDTNNNSIVARAVLGEGEVLLSGELEEAGMEAVLVGGSDLTSDVLKVSHHGSRRMVPAFYEATGATHALIPVGPNRYGHPAPETLVALRGMEVLRSDTAGDVTVGIDRWGAVTVRTERSAEMP